MFIDDYMTLEETAIYIRLSKATMYKIFNTEGFPSLRIGRKYFVSKLEFDKWMQDQVKSLETLKRK